MQRLLSILVPLAVLSFVMPGRAALPTPDPDDGAINLPPVFRALVVADNLTAGRPRDALRFITVAPNGDIYIKSTSDGIFALRDTNGDGRADVVKYFGTGNGTGIALHDGWLYYSTTKGVFRYKYTPGELVPQSEPQTIVSGLPDQGQHNAKPSPSTATAGSWSRSARPPMPTPMAPAGAARKARTRPSFCKPTAATGVSI